MHALRLLLTVSLASQSLAAQATAARPERIDVSSIKHLWQITPQREVRSNVAPTLVPLTSTAKSQLSSVVSTLRFPDYEYSGCHDRAHAAFLMLPPALKPYAAKIWLLSPERFTTAVSGRIGLRQPQPPGGPPVGWGYHVALAFLDGSNTLVYDAALAPGRLISEDDWYALMHIPKLSFATLVKPEGYLFNFVDGGLWAPFNDTFNGNWHPYGGGIPSALARDSVGAAILSGQACAALMPTIGDATALEARLKANNLPAGCGHLKQTYDAEVVRWTALLRGHGS